VTILRQGGGRGDELRIILPGVLRELADGLNELDVPSSARTTSVRAVLAAAAADRPQLGSRLLDETGTLHRHVNVFVDGQDVRGLGGLDAPVGPDAVVHILPSVAGG